MCDQTSARRSRTHKHRHKNVSLLIVNQPTIQDLHLHQKFSGGFSGKESSGRAEKCMLFSHDVVRTKKSSFCYAKEYLKVTCQKQQADSNLALLSQQLAYHSNTFQPAVLCNAYTRYLPLKCTVQHLWINIVKKKRHNSEWLKQVFKSMTIIFYSSNVIK
jgi:hypothetical protein